MLTVPPQPSPYGRDDERTLLVDGGVAEAVEAATRAGWDTWSAVRRGTGRWELLVGRRA